MMLVIRGPRKASREDWESFVVGAVRENFVVLKQPRHYPQRQPSACMSPEPCKRGFMDVLLLTFYHLVG